MTWLHSIRNIKCRESKLKLELPVVLRFRKNRNSQIFSGQSSEKHLDALIFRNEGKVHSLSEYKCLRHKNPARCLGFTFWTVLGWFSLDSPSASLLQRQTDRLFLILWPLQLTTPNYAFYAFYALVVSFSNYAIRFGMISFYLEQVGKSLYFDSCVISHLFAHWITTSYWVTVQPRY